MNERLQIVYTLERKLQISDDMQWFHWNFSLCHFLNREKYTCIFRFSDEISLIRLEDGSCGNKGNSTGWFVHDYKMTKGCKIYRGHKGALWSGNQTLTSGGCSWWYISWREKHVKLKISLFYCKVKMNKIKRTHCLYTYYKCTVSFIK